MSIRGLMAACILVPLWAAQGGVAEARHPCKCCPPNVVVHVCKPQCSGESSRRETAAQPALESAPIVQTVPSFGYGGMQMAMPYPVMPAVYGMPQYAPYAPQRESAPSQDCCQKLDRIERQMNDLKEQVDRLINVVDDHGKILEKLVERETAQP